MQWNKTYSTIALTKSAMECIPLHSWEMEFSIQYHVTINSQLNNQNSVRYYIISTNQSKRYVKSSMIMLETTNQSYNHTSSCRTQTFNNICIRPIKKTSGITQIKSGSRISSVYVRVLVGCVTGSNNYCPKSIIQCQINSHRTLGYIVR